MINIRKLLIKLFSILSLVAILISSPNFAQASLLGDQVDIEVIPFGNPLVFIPPNPSATVTGDPNNPEFFYVFCNPTQMGSTSIDIGESKVWVTFSSVGACFHDPHTVSLTDLDWVGENGRIVGVTIGACDFGGPTATFDDHEIHIEFPAVQTDNEESSCHFDIETEHDVPFPVGGELLPIDSTSLLLGGLQTSAIWMLPLLAGVAGSAFGVLYIKYRRN